MGEEFEPRFAQLYAELLAPDAVVLDLGANVGLSAIVASDFVPNGKVYAIEAAPGVYAKLCDNLQANRISNVLTRQIAISEGDGEVSFAEMSAYGHIDPTGPIKVSATSIDMLAEREQITRVDLIKIDIEGHEWAALRGAKEVLSRHQPVVYFEFNSSTQILYGDTNPREFLLWLLSEFQHLFVLVDSPDGPLLSRVTRENLQPFLRDHLHTRIMLDDLLAVNDLKKIGRLRTSVYGQ